MLSRTEDIIGIDFDNTIVSYDRLMYDTAVGRGLIPPSTRMNKKDIRDAIRHQTQDGEDQWTRLQAVVYGPLMPSAQIIEGVREFLLASRRLGIRTYIISHKTEYAKFDETGTNMRAASLDWMRQAGFFDPDGIGLEPEKIHFGATRDEKIAHIVRLGCTLFIDDLEEIFLDEKFPAKIDKILFSVTGERHPDLEGVHLFQDWKGICEYCFG